MHLAGHLVIRRKVPNNLGEKFKLTTSKLFCRACGAPLSAGALFCEVCGVKVSVAAPATAVTVAVEVASSAIPTPQNLTQKSQLFSDPNQSGSANPRTIDTPISLNTKRGRILRDTNNGNGLISVAGRQVPFTLETNWRGEIAPVVQMTVDVVLDDAGNAVTVMPVSDKEVAQEKLKEMSGNFSRKLQDQVPMLKVYANMIGVSTLIAVGLLFISWIWLSLATVRITAGMAQGATMFDVLRLINSGASLQSIGGSFSGSSGIYGFVCVLAMLAPLAPSFIRHRYISLTYFAPLLFILILTFAAYMKIRSFADDARQSLGSFGGSAQMANMANAMMDQILAAVSIGAGAYISLAVALYLAVQGSIKFLANR